MSVKPLAAHLRTVNTCITVGSPTSTLAGYFLNGLRKHIVTALKVAVSLATMQVLDLLTLVVTEQELLATVGALHVVCYLLSAYNSMWD